jgi:aspartokinase-like uncharacterized kinase
MMPLRRVVKVGGSLLGWDGLPGALEQWRKRQVHATGLHVTDVLIAGGGEFADAVRRADTAQGLGEEASHWLCVDALSVTARLLGGIAKLPVVADPEKLSYTTPAVFDPAPFLRTTEPFLPPAALPHSWAVTSDSIAARIAVWMEAHELVLLKSSLPMAADELGAAAEGYVDAYFPTIFPTTTALGFKEVRCVNLRSWDFAEVVWNSYE